MMTCGRCQGLMVERDCPSRHQRPDEHLRAIPLWCCVNCGDRVDDAIRFHRAMHKPETREQRHARIFRELRLAFQTMDVA